MKRLEEQGVIFVRLVDDAGVESYAAVYKGETIVPPSKAQELRKELRKTWNKTGDDLVRGLDEMLTGTHDIYLSFFKNANIEIRAEAPLGILHGQSTDYTCAATSLRMYLDDVGKIRTETSLAGQLKTVETGADRGASILNVYDGLYNMRLEESSGSHDMSNNIKY